MSQDQEKEITLHKKKKAIAETLAKSQCDLEYNPNESFAELADAERPDLMAQIEFAAENYNLLNGANRQKFKIALSETENFKITSFDQVQQMAELVK